MNPTIRFAKEEDSATILEFIRHLAAYEHMEDELKHTPDTLKQWIFDEGNAEVLFAMDDGKEAGFALFFPYPSTVFARKGIYMESLFVLPEYRGKGYGKALIEEVARITYERGYDRLEWWCIDWNTSSQKFYESQGAESLKQWYIYRFSGDNLADVAKRSER